MPCASWLASDPSRSTACSLVCPVCKSLKDCCSPERDKHAIWVTLKRARLRTCCRYKSVSQVQGEYAKRGLPRLLQGASAI